MEKIKLSFEAIGTKWNIQVESMQLDQNQVEDLIFKRIEKFDKAYSRFRPDSLVTKISKTLGVYNLPDDAEPMLDLYKELYKVTGGKFTPLIGDTLVEAGYDSDYSFDVKQLHVPYKLDEVVEYVHPIIKTKVPITLDFGAAGKGRLIDIIGDLLVKAGIENYYVEAGGDILFSNTQQEMLRVGLENPGNVKQVIGVVNIKNESICASSGNKRKWGNYHHIIDPDTLKSNFDILCVWVIAKTAMLADAIATCLLLVPVERLASVYNFEYLILLPDYSFVKSQNFKADLFINNSK